MADMKIRDYLTGRGVNDSDITYNNGNVMLKGKQFYGATPQADGSTYGDVHALNSAYNNYNMSDALDTFKQNLAKPSTPFSYDAQSDPMYQNALQAAQRGAQTAGNNATVALGARGIGNSQQALTTQNQIGQRAVADVNSNVLPQLMSQAYSRYHDQQVMDQQKNNDYLNLAGTYNNLGQQDFNNNRLTQQDERQTRQDHIDLANMLSQQYGVKVDPKDDPALAYSQVAGLTPLNMREFQANRDDATFNQGIQTKQLDNSTRQMNASIANMGADNSRQNLGTLFDIWDRTGVAPAGIPGVTPGTTGGKEAVKAKEEAAKKLAESAKKMESEKSGLVNALDSGDVKYSEAEKKIRSDQAAGFYSSDEAADLMKTLQTWASSAYGQRWN